jgi:hypothetical protein
MAIKVGPLAFTIRIVVSLPSDGGSAHSRRSTIWGTQALPGCQDSRVRAIPCQEPQPLALRYPYRCEWQNSPPSRCRR